MASRPAAATGSPTGLISNIRSGASPASTRRPDTTRLVDVPTRVTMPPRIAANESGIR